MLPIPRTPKLYQSRPPPPPKSWVPRGKIGDQLYEFRLSMFAGDILRIDAKRTRKMKYTPRGWIYILEGEGKIHKGEMDIAGKALTNCRKIGLISMDFFSEDQDETRRFSALHDAMDPRSLLRNTQKLVNNSVQGLSSQTTDYWDGEKYYLMMCVEKGDIRNLYEPICNEYHVPIVSSKGWSPLALLNNVVKLSMRAEARGLTPVLLLFYDLDPMGLKIAQLFRSKLGEIRRATGWDPRGLVIERVGLNKEDIDKYNLSWITNLKSASGRESKDDEYIAIYGRRKCESNTFFKNDETLEAAEDICRNAIERYYGGDALARFRDKENIQRQKLSDVYDEPLWDSFNLKIDDIVKTLPENVTNPYTTTIKTRKEVEIDVYLDGRYYGLCPKCRADFNYDSSMLNRLMRCRKCNQAMRLKPQQNN